ncbi:hypothetical protein ACWA1F_10665 [Flavobacterium sp. 3-218]
MQFWDYKKYYFLLSFLILVINNTTAQPLGGQTNLFININTEKYDIDSYSYTEDSHDTSEFSKLKIITHDQNANIAIIKSIDNLIENNLLIIVTNKKLKSEKMIIFMGGSLKPYIYYVLDIEFSPNIFSLQINRAEDLKVHKNLMGMDLTPKLKRIID